MTTTPNNSVMRRAGNVYRWQNNCLYFNGKIVAWLNCNRWHIYRMDAFQWTLSALNNGGMFMPEKPPVKISLIEKLYILILWQKPRTTA